MTISSSSIRHDMYTAVYTIVNALASSTGASSTPTVYGGFPDLLSISFPNIIIEPVEVRDGSYTVDETRIVSNSDIYITIHIFSKKNQDLDLIADTVSYGLKSNKIGGAILVGIESDTNNLVVANEQKVKGKTLSIHYLSRG